jgi:purine-binding chemotaxis protein CheW
LRRTAIAEERAGTAVAVVRLGGEYLGFPLASVREFAELTPLAPVPCTPPHVLGSLSLRGQVITVIDVRPALGVVNAGESELAKMVVSQRDELLAGVALDGIEDVIYADLRALGGRPAASAEAVQRPFVLGDVPFRERTVTVVDLAALLRGEALVVNELV